MTKSKKQTPVSIEVRLLRTNEIESLVREIKKFPNPLTTRDQWRALKKVYIASDRECIVGVCGITRLRKIVKIGPFVVFEQYQHRGVGRQLLGRIVRDFQYEILYAGSRNLVVGYLARQFGFTELNSILDVPWPVKIYLMKNTIGQINPYTIKEIIRKKSVDQGPYRNFIRFPT